MADGSFGIQCWGERAVKCTGGEVIVGACLFVSDLKEVNEGKSYSLTFRTEMFGRYSTAPSLVGQSKTMITMEVYLKPSFERIDDRTIKQ